MEIEESLRSRMLASGELADLIGQRIYAQEAPQDQDPPYLTYSTGDYEQMESLAGVLNLYSQNFRWECYGGLAAGGYSSAKAITRAIRAVLYQDLQVRDEICPGSDLEWCGVEELGGDDDIEPPVDAEGRGLDYVSVSARVTWRVIQDDAD